MSQTFQFSQLETSTDVPITSTTSTHEQDSLPLAIALPVCVGAFFIILAIFVVCFVYYKRKCLQKPIGPPMSRGSVEGSSDNGDNNNNNDGETDNNQAHEILTDGKILHAGGKPVIYDDPPRPSLVQQDTQATNPDNESFCIQKSQDAREPMTRIVIDGMKSPAPVVNGLGTSEVAMETVAVASSRGHESEVQETAKAVSVKEHGGVQKYIAVYAFEAENEDQMSMEPNDIVLVAEAAEHKGWLYGRKENSSKTGWFPKSHVCEVKQQSPGAVGTEHSCSVEPDDDFDEDVIGYECRALYDFDGVEDGELSFKAGDVVVVHHGIRGTGWWYGQCGDKLGWFPTTYVEVIPVCSLTSASFDANSSTTSGHDDLEGAVEINQGERLGITSTGIITEGSHLSPPVNNAPDSFPNLPGNTISKNVLKTNKGDSVPSSVKSQHPSIPPGKPNIANRLGLPKITKFGRRKLSTDEPVTLKEDVGIPRTLSPGKDSPEKTSSEYRQKKVQAPGKKHQQRPAIPPPQSTSHHRSMVKPQDQKIEQTELCNRNPLSRDPDLTLSDTNTGMPLKDVLLTPEECDSDKALRDPVKLTEDTKKTKDSDIRENCSIDILTSKHLQLKTDDKERQWAITLENFDRILEGSADFNEDMVSQNPMSHIPSVPTDFNRHVKETLDHRDCSAAPQLTLTPCDLWLTPPKVSNRNAVERGSTDTVLMNEVSQKPDLGLLSFAPPGFNDAEETLSPKFLNYLGQIGSTNEMRFRPADNKSPPVQNQSSLRPPLPPKPSFPSASPRKDEGHDGDATEDGNDGTLTFVVPKGRINRQSLSMLRLPDIVHGYITTEEYEHLQIPPPAGFSSDLEDLEENNPVLSLESLDLPSNFNEIQAPHYFSRTLDGPQGNDFKVGSAQLSHSRSEFAERVKAPVEVQTDTVVWKPWGHLEHKTAKNSSTEGVEAGLDSFRTRLDTNSQGFMFKLADGSVVFDESDVGLESAI